MKFIRIVTLLIILAITAAWAPAPGLSAAPAAPTSLTPATGLVIPNLAKGILTHEVTFTWAHATADSFVFQLSRNATFTNLVDLGPDPLTARSITIPLDPNTRYWFRVRAFVGTAGSPWTTARYISTLPESVESAASPVIGLEHGVPVLDTLRPTFTWDDSVAGVKTFDLQIFLAGANVASTTPKYSKTGIPAAQTQFTLPVDLVKNTAYKWRVRSRGTYGVTPWFGPGDPGVPGSLYFTTPNPPAVPVLLSPAAGKVLPANTFTETFTWKPVIYPDPAETIEYDLEISTDKTFAAVPYLARTLSATSYSMVADPAAPVFNTGTYYWRVRARIQPTGWMSNWSLVRVLKTQPRLQVVVLDELTNEPIAGATVKVGTLTATEVDGSYVFETVPAGARSVVVTMDDYLKKTVSTTLVAGAVRQLDIKLSKIPFRAVLTWGASPRDLDANLWLPEEVVTVPMVDPTLTWKAHVRSNFLGSTTVFPFARKNLDDMNGLGPETVTIQKRYPVGKYVYAVFLNGFDNTWANSKAVVKLYKGTSTVPVQTFTIQNATGSGRWWYVFEINGETGVPVSINRLEPDCPAAYDCINGEAVKPE